MRRWWIRVTSDAVATVGQIPSCIRPIQVERFLKKIVHFSIRWKLVSWILHEGEPPATYSHHRPESHAMLVLGWILLELLPATRALSLPCVPRTRDLQSFQGKSSKIMLISWSSPYFCFNQSKRRCLISWIKHVKIKAWTCFICTNTTHTSHTVKQSNKK